MGWIEQEGMSGTVTLAGGTSGQIAFPQITRTSVITLAVTSSVNAGGLWLDVQPGVGFTINSNSANDASTVQWTVGSLA